MKYHAYEAAHAALAPWRVQSSILRRALQLPGNPLAESPAARFVSASCELFEGLTRRYGKPEWGIESTQIDGATVPVRIEASLRRRWCDLLHFKRAPAAGGRRDDPKVLIVAPMSGHFATLLRGTVEAMLPAHDTYITDWRDAREVAAVSGPFGLDDFVDEIIACIRHLGPNTHVIAVCQPSVPTLMATAIMSAAADACVPASLTLMGGPIDTRRNPTVVNQLAESRPIQWFESHVITRVPWPNAGFLRPVYPGFIQLAGFMQMNLERHIDAHRKLFDHLVRGDCDSVEQHRRFYDEYLAVMDLPAEFYLETVSRVFQEHALARREMRWRGVKIDCGAIDRTALMTIEGERDDICGLGQTEAAHDLCRNLPPALRHHYVQPGVGHYGVFNGRRWRTEIQPQIQAMIRAVGSA